MNKLFKQLAAVAALALVTASGARADIEWGDWYIAPSLKYNDDDPDRLLDDGFGGFQIQGGIDLGRHYSIEGLIGYADIDGFYRIPGTNNFTRSSETHLDISANFLAHYNRGATLSPYAIVTLGYLGVDFDVNGGEENRPSYGIGGGVNWRPWSDQWSIRSEIRTRVAYEEDFNFTDWVWSLGVQYSFGSPFGGGRDDLPKDTDGDGVLDMWDECPDTPPGVPVNSRGCEIMDMERDSDGDRVPDYRDDCPNTPIGSAVDDKGCSLDSDEDGVPTDRDLCPASRPGADVDENGCENDSDGDGVLDQHDRCPDTARGARVDIYGCELSDVISLPGVNFATGSDRMLPGAEQLLRDAAATLNKYPNLQVEVAGHTDDVGDATLNLGLSDRRAKTVLDALVRYGVDETRLSYRGYGEEEPIADNASPDGRAVNRRVELRILSSGN